MPLKDLEARKAYSRDYDQRNRAAAYERVKQWRADNPGARTREWQLYRKKYPEKCAANSQKWIDANPESVKASRRAAAAKMRVVHAEVIKIRKAEYAKNNRGIINAAVARRKAAKLERTPKWLNQVSLKEIEFTYMWCEALRSCGLNYHVDHIIPMQSPVVSGLHVPWNLQVIPAAENLQKGNRWANA